MRYLRQSQCQKAPDAIISFGKLEAFGLFIFFCLFVFQGSVLALVLFLGVGCFLTHFAGRDIIRELYVRVLYEQAELEYLRRQVELEHIYKAEGF